ncbi:MAG: chitin synthase-domain-containing protein [Podila humilis]|nr:MAG: chitin synthase-domain-containing protein [Podila humilis]
MSYFEFTLFEHIRQLTGQRPERYHFLLTTEVGTITDHGSLEKMCQTLENNERIMAACGQRLFQNQTENWLTRIQDYGNFLENQFGKSFESTLGAVQGLPDELCLIRIKMEPSLKEMDDYRYSVPILVHPAVASVYCGSPKNTLHQRMMVSHSREDWFLTGLLHAAFPTRRIVYLPQATYRTRATTGFKIYLSLQRAEWNSRVHSLWEQMVSLQAPGTGIFRFWFHAISLLKLVLMPAMILFQWILIILVAVGASQGSNSTTLLDSPPAIIVLAFVTLAMIHQLILGVFLMRTGAMNLTGLGLMILTLPLRYLVVPLSALWSSEGMKTDIAGN